MKTSAIFFFMGLLLVGCAKEREYKTVLKENVFDKSFFTSTSDKAEDAWLYVPTTGSTPMNVTASFPYYMGHQKLVSFKFTEKNLEVLELPNDERFIGNQNNYSPILKLAISHVDYKCTEDAYGKCANKEEEDKDKLWSQKQQFKADFTGLTALEMNLPDQTANIFMNCFTETNSAITRLDLEKDAINITVQKTLKAHLFCSDISSWDDLRNMTFKIDHHYSFVRLSSVASKSYKPVVYPFKDQNTFGYFTTTRKKLTADNRTTLDSDVTYLNRWNPERKDVVFYLNAEFYEKGMEKVLADTQRAVNTVNNSLRAAELGLRIRLEDGRDKNIGDIRNSFIVLVKDPLASGPIGYGPSVVNPLTGEIIKAQTIMYYGAIRRGVQDTYEELIAEHLETVARKESSAAEAAEVATTSTGKLRAGIAADLLEQQATRAQLHQNLVESMKTSLPQGLRTQGQVSHHGHSHAGSIHFNEASLRKQLKGEIFSHSRVQKALTLEDEVEMYSRMNVFHSSMMNWHAAVQSAFDDGKIDLSKAKPWNELADSEKESLINELIPYAWGPTLVHELGHNLGLRHNFNGSEDKANYYGEAERAALNIRKHIPYSSVMDYSFANLNQLPVMGKYDIAALKFGYRREVELADGKVANLEGRTIDGQKLELKNYDFCTDEHVSVNPGCNRFDEGSNLVEIAQHYVRAYHHYYKKVNLRNNRLDFSGFNDAGYYGFLNRTFYGLRLFFEVYDRINGIYPGLTDAQWESIEFLKELKAATKIAADFYVDILKTPSVHCAVVDKASNQLAGIIALENITQSAISCFDDENILINKDKYAVIGQMGKHFNHARSPYLRGDIKADPTQLDVRGIWIDKVLAMNYLTKRELGISTFDDYRTSFLDYPEFKDSILESFVGIMSDTIETEVEVELGNGKTTTITHSFSVADTHNIKKSFSYGLNRVLGISKASTDFRELALPMVKKNLATADDPTKTMALHRGLSVNPIDPREYINRDEIVAVAQLAGGNKYGATEGNLLARSLLEKREVREKLAKFERAKLIEVYTRRSNPENPPRTDVEGDELYLESVDVSLLLSFLRGEIPGDDWFERIMSIMSV